MNCIFRLDLFRTLAMYGIRGYLSTSLFVERLYIIWGRDTGVSLLFFYPVDKFVSYCFVKFRTEAIFVLSNNLNLVLRDSAA